MAQRGGGGKEQNQKNVRCNDVAKAAADRNEGGIGS